MLGDAILWLERSPEVWLGGAILLVLTPCLAYCFCKAGRQSWCGSEESLVPVNGNQTADMERGHDSHDYLPIDDINESTAFDTFKDCLAREVILQLFCNLTPVDTFSQENFLLVKQAMIQNLTQSYGLNQEMVEQTFKDPSFLKWLASSSTESTQSPLAVV